MTNPSTYLDNFSFRELDKEIVARGVQQIEQNPFGSRLPGDNPIRAISWNHVKSFHTQSDRQLRPQLQKYSTPQLVAAMNDKLQRMRQSNSYAKGQSPLESAAKFAKGIWKTDDRMDVFEIDDRAVLDNSRSVAAICLEEHLQPTSTGSFELSTRNYREAYNLCTSEPFGHQPAAAGWLCTGFLVDERIIATAGHCADEDNVTKLRFIFGFKMSNPCTPMVEIPADNIYKGKTLIARSYDRDREKPDYALIQLDRPASPQHIAQLSREEISKGQPLYVMGHPMGLPLKYAPGATVTEVGPNYFSAPLDVYCGSSGSPVFHGSTHRVVGLVARGDNRDFRWGGQGWVSVIYPNPDYKSKEPQCTNISQFINRCRSASHQGTTPPEDSKNKQKSLRGSKGRFLQKEPLGRRRHSFLFL